MSKSRWMNRISAIIHMMETDLPVENHRPLSIRSLEWHRLITSLLNITLWLNYRKLKSVNLWDTRHIDHKEARGFNKCISLKIKVKASTKSKTTQIIGQMSPALIILSPQTTTSVRSRKRTKRNNNRTTKTLMTSWWTTIWWKNLTTTFKAMVRPTSICSIINSSRTKWQWLRKSWRSERRNQLCSTTSRSLCPAHSSTTWWCKLRRLLVVRNTK